MEPFSLGNVVNTDEGDYSCNLRFHIAFYINYRNWPSTEPRNLNINETLMDNPSCYLISFLFETKSWFHLNFKLAIKWKHGQRNINVFCGEKGNNWEEILRGKSNIFNLRKLRSNPIEFNTKFRYTFMELIEQLFVLTNALIREITISKNVFDVDDYKFC